MRDIREDPMLLELWREILHDFMPLMCHIIGVDGLLAARRDLDDRHKYSSSTDRSSNTPLIDEGGRDHPSPYPPPSPSPHIYEHVGSIPHPPLPPHLDEQADLFLILLFHLT
jgi:hypothetical protein